MHSMSPPKVCSITLEDKKQIRIAKGRKKPFLHSLTVPLEYSALQNYPTMAEKKTSQTTTT